MKTFSMMSQSTIYLELQKLKPAELYKFKILRKIENWK